MAKLSVLTTFAHIVYDAGCLATEMHKQQEASRLSDTDSAHILEEGQTAEVVVPNSV